MPFLPPNQQRQSTEGNCERSQYAVKSVRRTAVSVTALPGEIHNSHFSNIPSLAFTIATAVVHKLSQHEIVLFSACSAMVFF